MDSRGKGGKKREEEEEAQKKSQRNDDMKAINITAIGGMSDINERRKGRRGGR